MARLPGPRLALAADDRDRLLPGSDDGASTSVPEALDEQASDSMASGVAGAD
jgi:hypothetical protein